LILTLKQHQKIAACRSSYRYVPGSYWRTNINPSSLRNTHVGAAAGCDLLILILKTTSKDRSVPQLLQVCARPLLADKDGSRRLLRAPLGVK
jgi:hypothetical protein